jgi:hypothetical protein
VWKNKTVAVASHNLSALQAICRPAQQSGQQDINQIYLAVYRLKDKRIHVVAIWSNTNKKITTVKEELKD